jgi:hypothetical protein
VLVLRTSQSYTVYAVGAVARSGQQDFAHHEAVTHVQSHTDAMTVATTLVAPGGRIYLFDIDTAEWSEIAVA